MGYIYLAQGYSHDDAEVRQARYEKALDFCYRAINTGFIVYSPIVSHHPLATKYYETPKSFDFWRKADLTMIASASEFWCLNGTDWQSSKGFDEELIYWRLSRPNTPPYLVTTLLNKGISVESFNWEKST